MGGIFVDFVEVVNRAVEEICRAKMLTKRELMRPCSEMNEGAEGGPREVEPT